MFLRGMVGWPGGGGGAFSLGPVNFGKVPRIKIVLNHHRTCSQYNLYKSIENAIIIVNYDYLPWIAINNLVSG